MKLMNVKTKMAQSKEKKKEECWHTGHMICEAKNKRKRKTKICEKKRKNK